MRVRNDYRERLRAPVRWWLLWGLMIWTFWLAMAVALPGSLALGIALGLYVLLALALLTYGSVRIVVTDEWLHVGRARIERRFVGHVEALDAARMRAISGPEADARAYLVLRPYIKTAVRIVIDDPADPAPYWLVSARRTAALAAALDTPRATPTQQPGPSLPAGHTRAKGEE